MKKRLRFFKRFFAIIAIVSVAWTIGFGLFALKATSSHPYNINTPASAIVVLTGGEGRVNAGLNLFAAERGLYLYISGVFDGLTEDDIRSRWKGRSPLPICCVILDPHAQTTAQNALMTRAWIDSYAGSAPDQQKIDSIRLVTSNYHMQRALIDFKRILPDITLYPHPIVSPNAQTRDKLYWVLLVKEYHKYIFRLLQATLSDKWQEVMA